MNFVSHWHPNGSHLRDGVVRDRGRCPDYVRLIFRLSRAPPTLRPKNLKTVTALFLRLGLPSTLIRHETELSEDGIQTGEIGKRRSGFAFLCARIQNITKSKLFDWNDEVTIIIIFPWTIFIQTQMQKRLLSSNSSRVVVKLGLQRCELEPGDMTKCELDCVVSPLLPTDYD